MQALWKACFLLPVLFHRECATTIDGTSNDVPAHIIEERSQETSADPKLAAFFGVVSAALVLGTNIMHELPNLGQNLQNINWTRVQGDTSKKAPSLTQIVDKFGNSMLEQVSKVVINGNDTCYTNIGCFRKKENMSLPYGGPASPEEVGTVFYFFHNSSRNGTRLVVRRNWTLDNWKLEEMDDPAKPLMIVTHGFTGDLYTPWLLPLVDALLLNVNCNVIVADWRNGSGGPNYARAAANTPMAGVMISLLLEKIIKATNCTLHPDNVTLIGFSLGAHVVGFAGRHFHRNTSMLLGRITGLDPAGMLFEDTNVSLSRHDAKFVDVMHTNMGDIKTLQLGLRGTQGHVDFYPNGGDYQPGCSKHPNISIFSLLNASSLNEALLSVMESVACSHYRAPEMFTESLTNHDCTFTSYPCPGGWKNFTECKKEFEKNETVKGLMGYYSYTKKGRGKQYLQTNGKPPYCNNTVSGEAAVC
ncbi:pancreatic lipase-related protein 2-like isoform X2 [Haemaphysalis longicornis]